jgi:predicted chitinase
MTLDFESFWKQNQHMDIGTAVTKWNEQLPQIVNESGDTPSMRRIADAFESIARTLEAWYKSEHPEPKQPREAVRTYAKSPTSDLEKDLGNTGEATIEDWTTLDGQLEPGSAIGERERDFIFARSHALKKEK